MATNVRGDLAAAFQGSLDKRALRDTDDSELTSCPEVPRSKGNDTGFLGVYQREDREGYNAGIYLPATGKFCGVGSSIATPLDAAKLRLIGYNFIRGAEDPIEAKAAFDKALGTVPETA
mgnify:CR=1 FL=1